jgi:hypothetical protein
VRNRRMQAQACGGTVVRSRKLRRSFVRRGDEMATGSKLREELLLVMRNYPPILKGNRGVEQPGSSSGS